MFSEKNLADISKSCYFIAFLFHLDNLYGRSSAKDPVIIDHACSLPPAIPYIKAFITKGVNSTTKVQTLGGLFILDTKIHVSI